ncbi:hypothetical protein IPN35_00810 [Candidatus Peregrinibacteria bacterium]|nr:MAG: hypothetical protein IPN35_00810 [Candidatus Peregrinibacteria bacterium]
MNITLVRFEGVDDIKNAFSEIDVDPVAREIMMEKFQFLVLRFDDVRCVEANILKQEMLVLGGEAAVSRHSISCSVPSTPVLLAGSKKTFRKLCDRIARQVGSLPEIGQSIDKIILQS